MTLDACYDALGLVGPVTLRDIQRAYKRMALRYHPDRCGNDPESGRRFRRVTQAYSMLRAIYERREAGQTVGRCAVCGRIDRVIRTSHGHDMCAACLLGTRRRLLPLPVYRTIWCGSAIVCEAAAVWLTVKSYQTGEAAAAVAGMAAAFGALCALIWSLARADRIVR